MKFPISSTDILRALCSKHAAGTTVTQVGDGRPDWITTANRLRNQKTDYFSIGLFKSQDHGTLLMIEQVEEALVVLLLAEINGTECALLQLRTEPGLIGLCNLTATIQSTPSNYRREHGGKPTPFMDVVAAPADHGLVLYDSRQYDWGDYYVSKTKRFLVVRLEKPVDAPEGYCWVEMQTLLRLPVEGDLITNDLRVVIPILAQGITNTANSVGGCHDEKPPPSALLESVEWSDGCVDERGVRISYFLTTTETREVASWVQPLLVPAAEMDIRLGYCSVGSQRMVAIEERSQPGLLGHQVLFPAPFQGGTISKVVKTSAEGGRFWKFRINLILAELVSTKASQNGTTPGIRWMPETEMMTAIAEPMRASLELRMAASVLLARDCCSV